MVAADMAVSTGLGPGLGAVLAMAAGTDISPRSWLHSAAGSGVCLQLVPTSTRTVAEPHTHNPDPPAAGLPYIPAGRLPLHHNSHCQLNVDWVHGAGRCWRYGVGAQDLPELGWV